MKLSHQPTFPQRAFTLLEMTIVILVLLTLIGTGVFSAGKMGEWKQAREVGEALRTVRTAQRMFLADNPTTLVANITEAELIPYIPGVSQTPPMPTTLSAVLPALKSLNGSSLGFLVNEFPPRVAISGVKYDPSGSDTDSLWDSGK